MKHLTANDEAYFKVRKQLAKLEAAQAKLWIAAAEFKKKYENAEQAANEVYRERSVLNDLCMAYEEGKDIVLLKLSGGAT